MKKSIVLGVCLGTLAARPVLAQAGEPAVVVVRVAEYSGRTHLTIERPAQEPEEIEFDWDSRIGKKWSRASKGYLDALSKLYQQGYQVQATIPGAAYTGGGTVYTTLIFTRAASK
ncbi:hypothetical protein [Hymenobacter sp. BT559]|uniref:hypothetical protein n=1 Tax=Hymenobacter sp. BT559 TaxID=2795729 RepID=UPI0018EE449C|nr:hypothetical protein [Hymenobacter sp. BT559]MBJ6145557.1 hypothetical protein [Hymenobacter sp. BT559]